MLSTRRDLVLISALSAVLLPTSLVCIYYEAGIFSGYQSSIAGRVEAARTGLIRGGLSALSQEVALSDCLEAITSAYGRLQTVQVRSAILEQCHAMARDIAYWNPSHGMAWLVAGFASADRLDAASLNFEISASQQVTPNEQWIAEPRVHLAEQNLDMLNDEARNREILDLTLLAKSAKGSEAVAARYLIASEFRERIRTIVETLPQEDQTRFLGNINSAIARLRR